jgi:hypothetical protein
MISILYLNNFLFAINSDILFLPYFSQVCECVLCCSSIIPVKADYSKDKFYHVISEDQIEHLRAKLHLTMERPAGAPSLLGPIRSQRLGVI